MGTMTKKGKNKIVNLIFSRLFIMGMMVLFQLFFFALLVVNTEYVKEINQIISVISFFLVIYIISERKTDPTMKLIWAVIILAIPIFGCLLYLYVKFQIGSRIIKKKIQNMDEITDGYIKSDEEIFRALQIENTDVAGLSKYIYNYSGYPIYKNTEVKYFSSGEEKLEAMLEEIGKAKKFIFLEYFIIEEGTVWNQVLKALEEKKREGVEVRVMYDGMCSLVQLPFRYFKKLTKKGIACKSFSPMRPFFSTHQNHRDHRKILVIDGQVAFTGGINLADEYMNRKPRFGYWKDTAVMLRGDAAKSFTLMFLKMWNIGSKSIENFYKYLDVPKIDIENSQGYIAGFDDHPFDEENVGESVYLNLLYTAKRYVHIVSPYLVLDNVMMEALKFAAKRGVEVNIVMPGIPDKKYAFCIARTYYEELLEAGVKIYEFVPGFTHSKMFITDDEKAVVGTINLDYRSLYLHFECATFIYKNPEILNIEADYQKMLKNCRSISMMECHNRPLYYKLAGKLLRILAPLM